MAEMSSKERLLNAITGKEIDRVPWSPFLAYYWDKLPAAYDRQNMETNGMKFWKPKLVL